ncbi:MAG: glycosyltransferase family 1 protein [Verrucomicrobiae bacterium]|nr:glycosyltransferase family 1 protein [Verrucomicrobiae bacterium]
MKILLATDAWAPQVNGVVRTLQTTVSHLERLGHEVRVIEPGMFRTIPCPSYPEIRLAWVRRTELSRWMDEFSPDAVHVATEGPVGLAVRNECVRRSWPFTTSFATKFPEYIYARARVPVGWTYALLRWFHAPSRAVMVATDSVKRELEERGFRHVVRWMRGVDVELFRPGRKDFLEGARPILLYVGRVAVEKNVGAFLALDVPGTKYVVGDGPQRAMLQRRYPAVRFVGMKSGAELAAHYAAADVLVMPSRTETFGLVMLEALACGVPVAAYPVTGPRDVLGDSGAGAMDEDLAEAVRRALSIPAEVCRQHALRFSWEQTARMFLGNLHPRTAAVADPVLGVAS